MSVEATRYRPPGGHQPPAREIGVARHECLRVAVGVADVYLYPWRREPGTVFAHVARGGALETADIAPGTVDALLEIAPIVEATALLSSPAWPIVSGPTPEAQ